MDTDLIRVVSIAIGLTAIVSSLPGCGKPGRNPFALSASAPAPEPPIEEWPKKAVPQKAPDILPLADGGTWEMKATSGDEVHRLALKAVGELEPGDSKARFIETSLDGKTVDLQGYVEDERAIRLALHGPEGKDRIEPPMPVIKLPPAAGQSWKWKGKYLSGNNSADGSASFTMSGPEAVRTAAGEFEAWRVDGTLTLMSGLSARVITNTQWFAPGVGLVKQLTISDGEQDRLAQLTSYKVQSP